MEYLVSYRVINMDWCGLIIALVQKGRLETTSTFALWDKCTQSFFFRIEPIHIDHPVAGWYSAAHSWLDQQWQISFESHKRVSSLPLSPFSLGDPFLLEFLTLECLFPIGEAMEVWKHLDSPRKSHKKTLGIQISLEQQQLPFTTSTTEQYHHQIHLAIGLGVHFSFHVDCTYYILVITHICTTI